MKLFTCFVGLLFFGLICKPSKPPYADMYPVCDKSYATSELYFKDDSRLILKLRFVNIVSELDTSCVNYDSVLTMINDFYYSADLKFEIVENITIKDSSISQDMPSFIKYHLRKFKTDSVITCYIYDNYQPNYSDDMANTAGSAGGIGSTFFAIRRSRAYSNTVMHELGHCFSLLHVDTPDDSVTGYTIYSGDRVCSTRAVDNLHEKVTKDCTYTGEEELTDDEKEVLICNIMTWNYERCRGCLDPGQIRRLRFYIHESPEMRACIKEIK